MRPAVVIPVLIATRVGLKTFAKHKMGEDITVKDVDKINLTRFNVKT